MNKLSAIQRQASLLSRMMTNCCNETQSRSYLLQCSSIVSHILKKKCCPSELLRLQQDLFLVRNMMLSVHDKYKSSLYSKNIASSSHSNTSFVEALARCLALLATALTLLYVTEKENFPTIIKVGKCDAVHSKSASIPKPIKEEETSNKDLNNVPKDLRQENKVLVKNGPSKISLAAAIEKVQILCQRKKNELGTPGLVICVSVDGKQIYAEGFGHADLENEVPVRPDSVFRIASISKSITTAIAAKLWQDDKLDLDKTVQHYVPDFPQKSFQGEKVDILVKHLLSHTSGIRHYKKDGDPIYAFDEPIRQLVAVVNSASLSPFYVVGPNAKTRIVKQDQSTDSSGNKHSKGKLTPHLSESEYFSKENFATTSEALKLFKDDVLVGKPGSKYHYTTHGFTLLAAVIEAASGRPFPDLVTQTLAHFGLTESYLDKNKPIIYNRARFYMKNAAGHLINVPYVDNSYKWAGGGILSTAEDVVKFGNILLYSAQHEDSDPGPQGYLKASTVWKFWTSPGIVPRYGLGFELLPEKEYYGMCGHHSFGAGHTGNAIGASSILFIMPRGTTDEEASANKMSGTGKTAASMKQKCGATSVNKEKGLPQGVVVSVFVNISGVDLRLLAHEVARIFEKVDFMW